MVNLIKRAFNCPTKEISVLVYDSQVRETFKYTLSHYKHKSSKLLVLKTRYPPFGKTFRRHASLAFKLLMRLRKWLALTHWEIIRRTELQVKCLLKLLRRWGRDCFCKVKGECLNQGSIGVVRIWKRHFHQQKLSRGFWDFTVTHFLSFLLFSSRLNMFWDKLPLPDH